MILLNKRMGRILCFIVLASCAKNSKASLLSVDLGTASSFAVLAGSTVTNTGQTRLQGSLGVSPGTEIAGTLPSLTAGTIHANDALAMQAQNDLTTAYALAASDSCGTDLTGQDLGGFTLTAGVYCFTSSAQLTGTLTLNAQGDPNAVFLFQIGSTLTTASNSSVVFTNGGQGTGLFWQVGSSATLGTTTAFKGNILAFTSITMNTGSTVLCGRTLASKGSVTLDTNTVSITTGCDTTIAESVVPEPITVSLLSSGLLFSWIARTWKLRKT